MFKVNHIFVVKSVMLTCTFRETVHRKNCKRTIKNCNVYKLYCLINISEAESNKFVAFTINLS